jgi:type IV pilus assembly protein PilM
MAGMIAKPKGKKRSRVGLDIGTYSVKLVEISEAADKPVLAAIGSKKMLEQSKDAVKDTIKLLVEEAKISSKEVNIAVSGQPVVVRLVSMPKMTAEELKGAIKFEAEKFIPFNINDCIIDFQIVKKHDKDNKLDVLLAAVKKAYVEERLDMVSSAGLSVGVVDVDSFAIANAFLRNSPEASGPDKTFAILNIGAGLTNLTLLRDGAVCLVRDMQVGSTDLDTRKVFDKLVDEMRLPFSYYENQFGRGVDEIILSGGGVFLAGMSDMFQEAFGTKPILLDPFKFLDTSSEAIDKGLLEKTGSSFAVAVGLALR